MKAMVVSPTGAQPIPAVTGIKTLKAYVTDVKPEKRMGLWETQVLFGKPKGKYLRKEKRWVFTDEFHTVGKVIDIQVYDY